MASSSGSRLWSFIIDNSLLLIGGALAALVWANVSHDTYEAVTHGPLHFIVNDIGMVFFFGIAAKEVAEAMLPGGPLASPRQAAVPILAALGGMIAPAGMYALSIAALGEPELMRGWAIPCATDIAFSYLVARLVFPAGHAAIPFLLLLAIADDALGLIILAVFYPSGPLDPGSLALWLAAGLALAWWLRSRRVTSFWWYLLGPGALSWIGLYTGGLHPALALVPIVPFMPHGAPGAHGQGPNTMHDFEHWWKAPVQVILMFFGLANAGVALSAVGPVTWVVLGSLVIGKPLGIVGMTLLAGLVGFTRTSDLNLRALIVLGIAAGIGFTVALFFATAAFDRGPALEMAKMGALLSFLAAPVAVGLGRMLRMR